MRWCEAQALVKLSLPLFAEIDRRIGQRSSPSAFIEKVLRDHLRDEARRALEKPDRALINAHDGTLNAELKDVLTDQAPYV
jgi:hypothetical protein